MSDDKHHHEERDLLSLLLLEAQSYSQFEDLEKLVDRGDDLSVIPIQPLYLFIKEASPSQVTKILPHLSADQRQIIFDIDLWQRDQFVPDQFKFWLEVYSKAPKSLKIELVGSKEFSLFLKGVFTISTFDVEDPTYPEHDHFFITEDQLLLFEYDPQVVTAQDVQYLIKLLYAELGVEHAYAYLFKLLNMSFMQESEELYKDKKDRLRDYGFVDYYDALQLTEVFVSTLEVEKYLVSKTPYTGDIDSVAKNQVPFAKSLVAFKDEMSPILEELKKIKNEKRKDYLQFNFVRLVNAGLSLGNAFQEGSLAMTKIGEETKTFLLLGFSKLQDSLKDKNIPEGIFSVFDFSEIYKVGRSLLSMLQTKLKKDIERSGLQDPESDSFLGGGIGHYLDNLYSVPPSLGLNIQEKALPINNMQTLLAASNRADMLIHILPFIKKFYDTYQHLMKRGLIQDHFYLNYTAQDLDFEAIIVSSIINFHFGHYENPEIKKMGITTDELKQFIKKFFDYEKDHTGEKKSKLRSIDKSGLKEVLSQFCQNYGLSSVPMVDSYLSELLSGQLDGYDFEAMEAEDFRHVGGPILLRKL